MTMLTSFAQQTSNAPTTLSVNVGNGIIASMSFPEVELAAIRAKIASKPLPELWTDIEAQVKAAQLETSQLAAETIEQRRAERQRLEATATKHKQDASNFMMQARAATSTWDRQRLEANSGDSQELARRIDTAIFDFDNRFENEMAQRLQARRSKVANLLKALNQIEFVAQHDSRVIANRLVNG